MSVREVCIAGKCNNLITLKNGNIEDAFGFRCDYR